MLLIPPSFTSSGLGGANNKEDDNAQDDYKNDDEINNKNYNENYNENDEKNDDENDNKKNIASWRGVELATEKKRKVKKAGTRYEKKLIGGRIMMVKYICTK